MEKINIPEFVKQVSKASGYAQKDIREVLNVAAEVAARDLSDDKEVVIMDGVILYPGHYKARDGKDMNGNSVHYDEAIFPRARFTNTFKSKMLF